MEQVKSLKDAVSKGTLLTTSQIYDIIHKYLEEQIALATREMLDKDQFEQPSWSEYHAYRLGSIKQLNKLLEYIPTLPKEK